MPPNSDEEYEWYPPLYIYNIATKGPRISCYSPDTLAPKAVFLPSFASALELAVEQKVAVQCAIYSGDPNKEAAKIFIEMDDEEWDSKVHVQEWEEVERKLGEKFIEQARARESQTQAIPSEPQAQNNLVSIFKIGETLQSVPNQHKAIKAEQSIIQTIEEWEDEREVPRRVIRAFVEAIYKLVSQGTKVESALYGAHEGARIFIRD